MKLAPALKVLIGFEASGVVRRAFDTLGHDAWSCDLRPADDRSNKHLVGDIRDFLHLGWDLRAVMHPPCTRLTNSGVRWLHTPPPGRTSDEMWAELDEGAELFSVAWNAPIERVAVENPVMHKYAKQRIVNYRQPAQIVQPWWFGDPEFKATGLYLRNLPLLEPTDKLTPPAPGTDEHKAWSRVHRSSGWGKRGEDRWKERSRFFPGMARAMALRWGGITNDATDLFGWGVAA